MNFDLETSNVHNINNGLMLFYLILLSNYTGNILPSRVTNLINKYRISQHLAGLILLVFTIRIFNKTHTFGMVVLYSILIWLFLFLIFKQGIVTSIIIFVLLLISFVCYNIESDNKYIHNIKKDELKEMNKKYTIIQNACFYLILLVSIIGGIIYFVEHYKQYRKKSPNFWVFLYKYFILGGKYDN